MTSIYSITNYRYESLLIYHIKGALLRITDLAEDIAVAYIHKFAVKKHYKKHAFIVLRLDIIFRNVQQHIQNIGYRPTFK
jgi:hypothetical protein